VIFLMSRAGTGQTFYVSPVGDDANAGTSGSPWKTFRKAALTLTAGQTAVFADGEYSEPLNTTVAGSGTAGAPITFRPQNPRGARLVFDDASAAHIKVETPYVTIRDFEITATTQGTGGLKAGILGVPGGDFLRVINNKVWGTNWCVKANGNDVVVEDNELTSTIDGCFDTVNSWRLIVRRNNIAANGTNSIALLVKGGSHDARVYNNYFHTSVSSSSSYGIILGGTTDPYSTYDASGYEAYGCVAFDNIISADSGAAQWGSGMTFSAASNCALINNTVDGASLPLEVIRNNGVANGWTWNPPTLNPTWINNIIWGGSSDHHISTGATESGTTTIRKNLYHGVTGSITDNTYETSGAMFVTRYADWHLASGCSAIDAGEVATFTNSASQSVDMSTDYAGTARGAAWSMGAYD
jgi:hypothetical protein